jgi:hypothetical protein
MAKRSSSGCSASAGGAGFGVPVGVRALAPAARICSARACLASSLSGGSGYLGKATVRKTLSDKVCAQSDGDLFRRASERPAGAGCCRFGAARYGRCLRVFDLHPLIGSAGAIRRAEALRHDALGAECAGVLEDDRSLARVVLVEGDGLGAVTQKLRQDALALLDRRAPQVLAIQFEQVESAEHCGGVTPVSADQVENGETPLVELDGKRQEILIEAVPGLRRMAALADSYTTATAKLQALQEAARTRNVELSIQQIARGEEIAAAIEMAQATDANKPEKGRKCHSLAPMMRLSRMGT